MKATFLMILATVAVPAFAGTAVLGGDATMTAATGANLAQNTDAYAQFVSSGGASAVLDWSKFNIGAGKEMNFSGAGTTFFNLVDAAASKSQIDGIISGNGSVWVINPNGIAFGAASQVNVAGLFAAAAGNVSNADDLRSGAATMPAFSSFAGEVTAADGSKFTADQVALMGKTVSAVGDFTGVNSLTVNASSGSMTVDDVGGGKVSVNIGDFAVSDAEVSLGDLDVGGSLTVKSAGAIVSASSQTSPGSGNPMLRAVTKTGSVIQAGDIDLAAYDDLEVDGKLQSTAGNVSLLSYGNLDVNSEVDAYGSVSAQALGNVTISADVTARGGETGADGVTAYAYNGNVTVNEGSTVTSAGSVDITAGLGTGVEGNVKIDGSVVSVGGGVDLYSGYGSGSTGDVTINGDVAAAGIVDAYAGFGYAEGTSGNLTVNGNVTGGSTVNLRTGNGDIAIGNNAVVESTGFGGTVNLYTAADAGYGIMTGVGHEGDIVVNGTLKADNAYGQVDVVAGKEAGAAGSVTMNGKISSDYYSELAATKGEVTVNGEVTSLGIVAIDTDDGNITISKNAVVESKGGSQGLEYDEMFYGVEAIPNVMVLGAMKEGGTGNIKMDGVVKAAGQNGQIVVKTGFDGNAAGYTGGKGDIEVNGVLSAGGLVELTALDGDVKISGEKVDVAENMAITTMNEGAVSLSAQGGASISGNIVAAGDVEVNAGLDSLVVGGNIVANGDVTLETVNGDIVVKEDACVESAGDNSTITLKSSTGGMMFDENYNIVYSTGDIIVKGNIAVDGKNGTVNLYSANGFASIGSIQMDGMILADEVSIAAGLTCPYNELLGQIYPQDTYGTGSISINGIVSADSRVTIGTATSNVKIGNDAYVRTTGEDAALDIFSAFRAEATGGVEINGIVEAQANGDIEISSASGQYASGSTTIGKYGLVSAGGSLTLYSGFDSTIYENPEYVELFGLTGYGGSIDLNGKISANDGISMNSVNGVVSGSGSEIDAGSSSLHVNGGLGDIRILGPVKAGDVTFRSDSYGDYGLRGDVAVFNWQGNGDVSVSGESVTIVGDQRLEVGNIMASGGDVRLQSNAGDLTVNGSVSATGNVLIYSTDGDLHVASGADVRATGADGGVSLATSENGKTSNIRIDGRVAAEGDNGFVAVMLTPNETAKGSLVVGKSGVVRAEGRNGKVSIFGANGVTSVAGRLESMGNNGSVSVSGKNDLNVSGSVEATGPIQVRALNDGDISVSGTVRGDGKVAVSHSGNGNLIVGGTISSETDANVYNSGNGNVTVSGHVSANGEATVSGSMNSGTHGDVTISGSVEGGTIANVYAGDGTVTVNGTVTSKNETYVAAGIREDSKSGNVNINGTVSADGNGGSAYALTGLSSNQSRGDINFGESGQLRAADGVYVVVNHGDIQQAGATLPDARDGHVESTSLHASMKGATVNVKAGGNIGSGKNGFVAVDGKAYVEAQGDISIAAANGGDLKGGPAVGSVDTAFGKITFGDPNGNSSIKAGGDLSVYTAGKIESSGLLQAGGDLTVSAVSFGDVSYLQAGGTLTINNVGKSAHPKIAYFESVNGVEPKINNLPNDMVIFVDGRLAGGNLKTLNQFGANEAFMVETPELKSTQGIFGSPVFLHGDLDVANPMEVGSIDYMLQETPRLTLDKDFPREADQHVDSVVIPERDSIQFGRGTAKAESAPDGDDASAAPNGKVAMVR